jgi:hypothetical protein
MIKAYYTGLLKISWRKMAMGRVGEVDCHYLREKLFFEDIKF